MLIGMDVDESCIKNIDFYKGPVKKFIKTS